MTYSELDAMALLFGTIVGAAFIMVAVASLIGVTLCKAAKAYRMVSTQERMR